MSSPLTGSGRKPERSPIDWSKLRTAHGTAEGIPKALEALQSEDPQIRKKGYWSIDNVAILQGDLYEAAYYLIDPLFELLSDGQVPDKGLILELLIEISLGWAPSDMTVTAENGQMIPLQQACRNKLRQKRYGYRLNLLRNRSQAEDRDKITELLEIINSFESDDNNV